MNLCHRGSEQAIDRGSSPHDLVTTGKMEDGKIQSQNDLWKGNE